MKILCFIDSLGSGGAQRQIATLAAGLKARGHELRFLVYREDDHFLHLLQVSGISCRMIPPCSYIKRVCSVSSVLREGWQDVVLAFLEAPSFYAELAGIPSRRWALVVGERLADPGIKKVMSSWLRQFHRIADAVVSNSHTNRLMLEYMFPFLRSRLFTVYNTVDLKLFRPSLENTYETSFCSEREFRIVIVASYQEKKNMMNVAKALQLLKKIHRLQSIVVHWFGAMPTGSSAFNNVERFVIENDLSTSFYLHSATKDVEKEYLHADVVALFSFYEGLPNVICEGMACGKPILMSDVCDASNLVKDGANGFLCDPDSPEDIADKILHLFSLSEEERQEMGKKSRLIAEQLFAEDLIVDRYEHLLISAAKCFKISNDCNWPDYVPKSALKTVEKWKKS
jgi:glycosyltransferase involved in cell wall biosynthesis